MKRGPPAKAAAVRDLRLALIGASCMALGACLLLAACTETPPRPAPEPAPAVSPPPPPAPPVKPAAPPPAAAAAPAAAVPVSESPWPRLRASFELPGCGYNAQVQRWTRSYAQTPKELTASLRDAMPYLLVVSDLLARNRLPGEFAFLPFLESNYTPIASSGDRAAGIWQLMPDTAIEAGLRITPEYDGRLDIHASTIAAISLLRQYHDEFGDWRLADMAFNAGLYKVRQLLNRHPYNTDWSERELTRLGVKPGTHDHLAKLLALSCIVGNPERYHVTLPDPELDDIVVLLELPAPVDLHLAARLAGLDFAELQRLNPGLLRAHMPANGPFHLLVPSIRRVAFESTLGKLPQYAWRNWHEVVLRQPETLDVFATFADIDRSALATINGRAADAQLAPGTRLLVPGTAKDIDLAIAEPAPAADDLPIATPDSLVVRAGDTLWDIAHRYGVHVEDLLRWNGLSRNATLHLGQHLLLNEPEHGGRPAL